MSECIIWTSNLIEGKKENDGETCLSPHLIRIALGHPLLSVKLIHHQHASQTYLAQTPLLGWAAAIATVFVKIALGPRHSSGISISY